MFVFTPVILVSATALRALCTTASHADAVMIIFASKLSKSAVTV